VFKNSVEEIPRRSTETVRNEERHNYPTKECIVIVDGNIARKGHLEQIRTALFWLIRQ